VSGEVSDHDARAAELNTDLARRVGDRSRALDAEIYHALNLARQGIIEDVEPAPVPPELKNAAPGSQEDSGAFRRRIERIMRAALHEYRDQASRTVRAGGTVSRARSRCPSTRAGSSRSGERARRPSGASPP
jgi:hypothetical protein